MQARLCTGVHTQLQVVLHEFWERHPLAPEIDDMLVTQMRRLGLSQFIDTLNVEIPGAGAPSTKRRAHLVATIVSDSSEEAYPPQSGAGGDTAEGEDLEEPS